MGVAPAQSPPAMSKVVWQNWADLPWLARGTSSGGTVQLSLRILEAALSADDLASYLKTVLPEIASELAAVWVGIASRPVHWNREFEFGRLPLDGLPQALLAEALERDAAGLSTVEPFSRSSTGWTIGAASLERDNPTGEVLVICGRELSSKMLPEFLAVARALGFAMAVQRRQESASARVDRLRTTLQIASQLNSARETKPLLEVIAREAARLLGADRSSIFLWDREHKEVVAMPALGFEGNVLRLPDDLGIVGQCLKTGEPIRVDDAYRDPRFNQQIDSKSGYKTRTVLCVALADARGQRIGAFEALNKLHGTFTNEDEVSLSELGIQAATALANAHEHESSARRNRQLTEQVTQGVQIVGESAAITALRSTIERLAATDLPVLILGESGTGKEVVAQSLHYKGPRRDKPFVAVNCAAMAETLLESELFGHEKGAFTDAHEARQGKFELAEGGTLFLDEIGDMSPNGQAKLLRVLEQKTITRVGGSQPIRTNVRVIAATNVNLAGAVREKRFREDLYYRLSVVALELPPLRDRPEDVLPLAEFFLAQFSKQAGRPGLRISPAARKRLQAHVWPGNIRELRNMMERVAFLCPGDEVQTEDLEFILSPARTAELGATDVGLAEATVRFQQDFIRRIIKRVRGNMTEAAQLLGLHRSNLYRKMQQLGMEESAADEE